MTQVDRIRAYYRENPKATYQEAEEALGIKLANIKANISRDLKQGLCIRDDNGINYDYFYKVSEEAVELREYAKEVLQEQIENLRQVNRLEKNSDQCRLNGREIRTMLKELMNL